MKAQELTLVGLTEDGTKLVLVSDTGDEFTLPADAKLRAALRGDHARLGQLEIKMESALRPRDIQARIRSGESPETVAAAAQTTVDRIMGFAMPVLAERAHIADRAQRASVRRKAGEAATRVLGDAVSEQLRSRNVDPESVAWDAWRREDGRWTLVADYRAGEGSKHAEFVFDAPGRYVVAENDEARWLVGEPTSSKASPARGTAAGGRRLSAVGSDEELPLGEDAIELVAEDDAESTVDLTATARAVRSRETAPEPQPRPGNDGWLVTQATDRPAAPARTEERRRPAPEPVPEPEPEEAAQPAAEEQEPEPSPVRKTARRKGRASVPSWDEIMFGGGRQE